MRSSDEKGAAATNKTPLFGFLAGLGVGAILGWLRVLFHGNSRHQNRRPLVSEKNYSKSEAVSSGTSSEADHFRTTEERVFAHSAEPVRVPSILPTPDEIVALEPPLTNERVSDADTAAEDERPRNSLAILVPRVPSDIPEESAPVASAESVRAPSILPTSDEIVAPEPPLTNERIWGADAAAEDERPRNSLAIVVAQVPSDISEESTPVASGEPVHVVSILATFEDIVAHESSSTKECISRGDTAVEDESSQESHHGSDKVPHVPVDIPEDPPTMAGEMFVATQNELVDSPPASSLGLNSTNSLSPENQRRNDATAGVSESSQVVGSKNSQRVHEQPARTSIHRPRPVESAHEYGGSVSEYLSPAYLQWNLWIAEQVFVPTQRNEQVYLSITPTILAGIAADYRESPVSPLEAEREFAAVVSSAYASTIAQEDRLRVLRRLSPEGVPLCLAFLGISVLAAYRMQSDEETSGGAYYFRLAEILGCEMVAGHPRGFDPVVFESLWVFVQTWLVSKTGAHLVLPSPEARRFVALPLTHVPLRRLDIEKLPTFFAWAGYTPGVRVSETKLRFDLERWVRSYALLSSAGTAAVMDDRRQAVLAQAMHELGAWDGSVTESGGRRSATVQLMLDIVRQRPDLFYLPRRPDGFPALFDDGLHVLEAADDGFYGPLQLSVDSGSELSDGFEWKGAGNVSLRRGPATLIALGPSPDYTGFLSRPNLLRGTACAVLCAEALALTAADYLGASMGRTCSPISYAGLPRGWSLFVNVLPTRKVDVPTGLDALSLASEVDIICTGGLRLGRRREWLAGAPPKIIVTGLEQNEVARIDGEVVSVNEDGALQTNGHLLGPGVHSIEAGNVQRTVEIVEPRIDSRTPLSALDREAHHVTLPAGQWYVIGASPDQATGRIESVRPGKICKVNFEPVWAISVGGGPGARVICIPLTPAPPVLPTNRKPVPTSHLRQWVAIVYDAAMRRPQFASLLPNADQALIDDVWKKYASLARRIKRQWRSGR